MTYKDNGKWFFGGVQFVDCCEREDKLLMETSRLAENISS